MGGILALDRGNHSLKAALIDSGGFVKRWRDDSRAHVKTIVRILNSCSPEGAAFSSVVPEWTDALKGELTSRGIEPVIEAGADVTLPFKLLVDNPERVGPDRLCAVCGAVARGLREAVIIDAGTAVTVDVLSPEGFLGGMIFPGLDILLRSLHEGTAALPLVEFEGRRIITPGRNTEEAVVSGSVWGLIGAVQELVNRSKTSLSQGAEVLITGGGSGMIAPHLRGHVIVEPDLVLKGLFYIFETNLPDSTGLR